MQSALPPSQPEPPAPGKAVLKAGRRFYISSAYIAGVHSWAAFGSLCCARDHRDRQRPGKTRSPAPACQHFHAPMIFALSLFLWFVGIGALIGSFVTGAHSTTSAMVTPSAPTRLVSRQTPISLDSLKNRFLDQIRTQQTVSIADFRTDQESRSRFNLILISTPPKQRTPH